MVVRDLDATRSFSKYLMDNEEKVLAVRRHPASLLRYIGEVFGGLILAGLFSEWLGPGPAMTLIWVAWLVVLSRLVWKVIAWSVEFFIVTEHRLMYLRGIIRRRVGMIPLRKISDIKLERPLQGRLLDYGTFIMESAGQDQAFRNVTFMPYPEQLYFEVSSMIFPVVDESPD